MISVKNGNFFVPIILTKMKPCFHILAGKEHDLRAIMAENLKNVGTNATAYYAVAVVKTTTSSSLNMNNLKVNVLTVEILECSPLRGYFILCLFRKVVRWSVLSSTE